jgi:hypothetical protein
MATFRFNVRVNEVTYRSFSDLYFIRRRLDKCDTPVEVMVNGRVRNIPVEGHSRYFRLLKKGRNNKELKAATSLISFGNVFLLEIPDVQLGRLMSEAHTEHLIAP